MKTILIIAGCLALLLSSCSTPKATDPDYASHLKSVRSDLAITYCEKDIKLKHVAALEWFDANRVIVGEPASGIGEFLSLALAKIEKHEGVLYKFPLAPPAGNHVLTDEPRAQYNHYAVWVNKKTGLVAKKQFNRYKW